MKKLGLTFTMLLAIITLLAQPKLEFDQTTYDFGTVQETEGKITGRFTFTNTGTEDLMLTAVRPGCGCTAANYTKTAVKPGEKGFIDATYDPYNRPGSFNKNIRVTSNAPEQSEQVIYIKGNVVKRPPTEFEKHGYQSGLGMARLKNNSARVQLLNSEKHLDTVRVRNFWNKPVNFKVEMLPYVREVSRSFGEELQPATEGVIVLEYDAAKRAAVGTYQDKVGISTSDSLEQTKYFEYNVKITEDFSGLTKNQIKKSPAIVWDTLAVIDFEKMNRNQKVERDFTFTNSGKGDLLVRQIQISGMSVAYTIDKEVLKPGEMATIHLTLTNNGRKGKQNGSLDIITNDHKKPMISVKMTADYL
jgi:hypothetical protein